MARYKLTDRKIRNAKPGAQGRLADGDNLYVLTPPSGVFSWQLRYVLDGKRQTHTIGRWPVVGLAEARELADEARARVARGEHLTQAKRAEKLQRAVERTQTFQTVAAAWIRREASPRGQDWTEDYRREVEASVRNHLSSLNRLPLSEITFKLVAPLLMKVERKAPLMVEKVKRRLHAIIDFGVEQGYIDRNPLPRTRGAKVKRRHFPAVTTLADIGEILRGARAAEACKGVHRGHALLAYTAQRVSEVVGAPWSEFDLERGDWVIPRTRMKQHRNAERGAHVLPVPPVLLSTLREWRAADGPDAVYVCPAPRDPAKPVTAEAVEKFYRRTLGLSGKHSPHSWRSTFSTICRDAGKDGDVIEAQLDHIIGGKIAAAYDRAQRIERRRELVTWYELAMIAARDGAAVLPLRARSGQ